MMFQNYFSLYPSIFIWFLADKVQSSTLTLLNKAVRNENCVQISSFDEVCAPESQLVTFHLYTRERANNSFKINFNNIEEAPFLPSAPLKVLVHGYTGWKDYSPNMELRPAFYRKGDYNLVSIDWSQLAKEGCYIEAAYNTEPVGQCVALWLEKVVQIRKDMKPEDIHVIGFSLGAHVAGNIGKSLRSFRATRITGLDPALPLFDDVFNNGAGLTKEDAEFVDVIHTNGGMKGKPNDVGDVDFYANGGSIQPGCAETNTSCHHVRAVEIYAESIYSEVGFYGYKCSSLIDYMTDCCSRLLSKSKPLGEYVDSRSIGSYYFDTSDKFPFAIGNNCRE